PRMCTATSSPAPSSCWTATDIPVEPQQQKAVTTGRETGDKHAPRTADDRGPQPTHGRQRHKGHPGGGRPPTGRGRTGGACGRRCVRARDGGGGGRTRPSG